MWFTVHGQHDSRSRVKSYTRSLSCRPSFLSQARENMPPADADSWKPLFDFTVYGQWVHPVYEAVWLRNISGFTMCSVCVFSTPEMPFTESLFVWPTNFFSFFYCYLIEARKKCGPPTRLVWLLSLWLLDKLVPYTSCFHTDVTVHTGQPLPHEPLLRKLVFYSSI